MSIVNSDGTVNAYIVGMKSETVAVPVYQERISPLLDVAKKFAIFEIKDGEIRQKSVVDINAMCEPFMVDKLKDLCVSVIIGDAVSGFVSRIISEKGMRLIPWVNGAVDDVIELYIKDALVSSYPDATPCGRERRRGRCSGNGRGGKGRFEKNKEEA